MPIDFKTLFKQPANAQSQSQPVTATERQIVRVEEPANSINVNPAVALGGAGVGGALIATGIFRWLQSAGDTFIKTKANESKNQAEVAKAQAELDIEKERQQTALLTEITKLLLAKHFDAWTQLQDITYDQQAKISTITTAQLTISDRLTLVEKYMVESHALMKDVLAAVESVRLRQELAEKKKAMRSRKTDYVQPERES